MKKQSNVIKVFLVAALIVIGVQITVKAQEPEMYTYFIKDDGKIYNDDPMDAVAAVKSTESLLSGISYDNDTGTLTLNGLQADTLRVYAKKIHLMGTSKITNFIVNTKIQSVTADTGSSFSCTKATGKNTDTFFDNLPSDISGSGTSVSKGSISLNQTSASIYAVGSGNSVTLKATTQGNGTVNWSSSNSNVATVNNGIVTGKSAGNVVITATLINSNNVEVAKAACSVNVKSPTIALNSGSASIYASGSNSSVVLAATVNGATSGNTVTWSSSNTGVATVANGTVKAVKAGSTTITASSNGVNATCKVTVKEPTLSLSKTSATIYTKGEKTVTLVATVNGSQVSGSNVTWSTSDKSIAKVENGKITAVASGSATITAKANGVSKTCKVTVKKPSISVSPTSVTIKKGKTTTLTTTVKPTTGTPSYSSSKKSVATVSSKGVITGVAAGEATITVTCNGASAQVKVTVTK